MHSQRKRPLPHSAAYSTVFELLLGLMWQPQGSEQQGESLWVPAQRQTGAHLATKCAPARNTRMENGLPVGDTTASSTIIVINS